MTFMEKVLAKRPDVIAKIKEYQESLIKKPVDIIGLANDFGLTVYSSNFSGGESGAIYINDGNYCIYANKEEPEVRRRFTYAHELSHFLLHKESVGNGFSESTLFRSNLTTTLEIEANRLASDILIPKDKLIYAIDHTKYENINRVAELFGVSGSAILIRLGIPV